MSAYQEGDRVRVAKAMMAADGYIEGSTGTVLRETSTGSKVAWDHGGSSMVFDCEITRIHDEPADTHDAEPDELTVWDRYAITALQSLGPCSVGCEETRARTAERIADNMMELRRGKAS